MAFNCDFDFSLCNNNITRAIGIILSIAFVTSSLGLIIAGAHCVYGDPGWKISKDSCLNMYLSGILMCFLLGLVVVFNVFICIVDRCELPPPPVERINPIRANRNRVEVKKKKKKVPLRSEKEEHEEEEEEDDEEKATIAVKKIKGKKSPLQSVVVSIN